MQVNPERDRQRARILEVRARIRAGAVPDRGIDLARRKPVACALDDTRTGAAGAPPAFVPEDLAIAHIAAWARADRARRGMLRMTDAVWAVCAAADDTGVTAEAVLGRRKFGAVAAARQEAMYLMREHSQHSFCQIGRMFGRDHSTVLYAVDRVREALAAGDEGTAARLTEARRLLGLS